MNTKDKIKGYAKNKRIYTMFIIIIFWKMRNSKGFSITNVANIRAIR